MFETQAFPIDCERARLKFRGGEVEQAGDRGAEAGGRSGGTASQAVNGVGIDRRAASEVAARRVGAPGPPAQWAMIRSATSAPRKGVRSRGRRRAWRGGRDDVRRRESDRDRPGRTVERADEPREEVLLRAGREAGPSGGTGIAQGRAGEADRGGDLALPRGGEGGEVVRRARRIRPAEARSVARSETGRDPVDTRVVGGRMAGSSDRARRSPSVRRNASAAPEVTFASAGPGSEGRSGSGRHNPKGSWTGRRNRGSSRRGRVSGRSQAARR